MTAKFEQEKSLSTEEEKEQVGLPSTTNMPVINIHDQMELKAVVDAIAAASHREAEAHEMAIMLSKENDELRMKLKALIEDNSKLIQFKPLSKKQRRSEGEVWSTTMKAHTESPPCMSLCSASVAAPRRRRFIMTLTSPKMGRM
ncbi:hypothetical protein Lalb_Chr14g0375901 [Lupinus albus]|uniref:Uncharacterized protein n=1 Tax=Lupinus albus TaxID=3870 RepID=A0A6A4PGW5_LUPAL|nr:hypothetical protein Lalb_Chr14g0375901 [Lupinus albus]